MSRLFEGSFRLFSRATTPEQQAEDAEVLVIAHAAGSQSAVASLYVKFYPMMCGIYIGGARAFMDEDEYDSQAIRALISAAETFDVGAGVKFSTYLQTCLNNMVRSEKTRVEAQKRPKESNFSSLETRDEDGGVIEFDIAGVDHTEELVGLIDLLERSALTERERQYVEFVLKSPDGYGLNADFAEMFGFKRQYVTKIKNSLKVKLAGLQ